jgi:hypothetical protein
LRLGTPELHENLGSGEPRMTSLLSSISGQFTKSLLLGTFLPVVVFVILGLATGLPLLPPDWPLLEQFKALDKEWLTLAASFLAVLIAGLLYSLNIPIIRFYEGYPWKGSLFGRAWCKQKAKERYRLRQIRFRLQSLMESWQATYPDDEQKYKEMDASLRRIYTKLVTRYSEDADVLPTRLGNTIRSAERYPQEQYKLDSVSLWPRMIAVIPKDYAAGIDDAKSIMDFFLNASVLSSFLAIFLLIAGLGCRKPLSSSAGFWLWFMEVVLASLAAWQCYRYANSRAAAWGEVLRASYDLYRFDLLKQLGYHQVPATRHAERELWAAISRQITFGDNEGEEPGPYCAPRFETTIKPDGLQVLVSSGVQAGRLPGELLLFCKLENAEKSSAATVTLRVNPPDGYEVKWDSAFKTGESAPKESVQSNGQAFDLGKIPPSNSLVFECGAVPLLPHPSPAPK